MVNEKSVDENNLAEKTRQVKRERRRGKAKAKMLQHGKGLAKVYRDAVAKRVRGARSSRHSG